MIVLAVLVVTLWTPQTAATTLAEARRLINAGQPAQAIEQLKTIAGDQDQAVQLQASLLLGIAHYHADDPAKAPARSTVSARGPSRAPREASLGSESPPRRGSE